MVKLNGCFSMRAARLAQRPNRRTHIPIFGDLDAGVSFILRVLTSDRIRVQFHLHCDPVSSKKSERTCDQTGTGSVGVGILASLRPTGANIPTCQHASMPAFIFKSIFLSYSLCYVCSANYITTAI